MDLSRVFSGTRLNGTSPETEWADQASPSGSSAGHKAARLRGGSTPTDPSRGSFGTDSGYVSSPTGAIYRSGPTPPESTLQGPVDALSLRRSTGFELCPACVEVHGVSHAREASRGGMRSLRGDNWRHAYREKIWGHEGWVDVGQ